MDAIAAAAPMKTYTAGEILHSPAQPSEVLFILKRGRVRIFRVSADGRALTCAIISPGTIFGEMALLGQRMYDNFAEALDDVTVCVMSHADVQKFLLSDARIAARITEILGRRLADLEQRLSDTVFKSVPQRIATTLTTLATRTDTPAGKLRPGTRHPQIALPTNSSPPWPAPPAKPRPKCCASSPTAACSALPAAASPSWSRPASSTKPDDPSWHRPPQRWRRRRPPRRGVVAHPDFPAASRGPSGDAMIGAWDDRGPSRPRRRRPQRVVGAPVTH